MGITNQYWHGAIFFKNSKVSKPHARDNCHRTGVLPNITFLSIIGAVGDIDRKRTELVKNNHSTTKVLLTIPLSCSCHHSFSRRGFHSHHHRRHHPHYPLSCSCRHSFSRRGFIYPHHHRRHHPHHPLRLQLSPFIPPAVPSPHRHQPAKLPILVGFSSSSSSSFSFSFSSSFSPSFSSSSSLGSYARVDFRVEPLDATG